MRRTGTPPESGVYYRRADYATVRVRLLSMLVDFVCVLALVGGAVLAGLLTGSMGLAALLGLAALWGFLVELKRSARGTPGPRLLGLRIVDLHGRQPGRMSMVVRLGFGFFAPITLLVDLSWILSDDNRQALRDKLTGTYVIRRDAEPVGTGGVRYTRYMIAGTSWVFPEVARPLEES